LRRGLLPYIWIVVAATLSACGSSTAQHSTSTGRRAASVTAPSQPAARTLDYLQQQGSQRTRVAIYLEQGKVGLFINGVPAMIEAAGTSYICGGPTASVTGHLARCVVITKSDARGSKAGQAVEALAAQYLDPLGRYDISKSLFHFETSSSQMVDGEDSHCVSGRDRLESSHTDTVCVSKHDGYLTYGSYPVDSYRLLDVKPGVASDAFTPPKGVPIVSQQTAESEPATSTSGEG
jgi:hypothetical protein